MHSVVEGDRLLNFDNASLDVLEDNSQFTLLIVDDDSVNRIVLKGMLIKYGYTVIVAENGRQAIELFETSAPDLILMDVMMPEMDGYETTKIIKQKSGYSYIPIIFLTAILDEKALVKCVTSGGDDFLSKPFNPVVLKARIDALLRVCELYKLKQLQNEALSSHEQAMQNDLDIAARILSKISTKESLDIGNINHHLSPMEQLNGDIILAQNKPDGGQHFLLGDFTGHGLGAAIGGLLVFDVFKTMTTKGFSVSHIISEINQKLREILPVGRFLAAGFIELDAEQSVATIWNCGLPDIYFLRSESGINSVFPSNNMPLGILSYHEMELSGQTVLINHGDRIVVYSDGVTESENEYTEMYGSKRLEGCLNSINPAKGIIPHILDEIKNFTGDCPQRDDVSLLEIICDPTLIKTGQQHYSGHKTLLPATSWSINFALHADAIKEANVIPPLVQMIVDLQGLHHFRQTLYLILSELYSNAVDHGLLELDSVLKSCPEDRAEYHAEHKKSLQRLAQGMVMFNLTHEPHEDGGKMTLKVSHDGEGYDIGSMRSLQTKTEPDNNKNRRGIRLVQSLCDRLECEDFGRSVEVDYVWKNTDAGNRENDEQRVCD